MPTTPETIRTLQRKLYAKAKQEPAYRCYALYDKTCREDILSHARCLVRSNGDSPGIDGVTFEAIERGEGAAGFLRELARDLQAKTCRAQPVRRVRIPKADGSMRPLGKATIRDRVAQMAVKLVIEPIFEADFCDHPEGEPATRPLAGLCARPAAYPQGAGRIRKAAEAATAPLSSRLNSHTHKPAFGRVQPELSCAPSRHHRAS